MVVVASLVCLGFFEEDFFVYFLRFQLHQYDRPCCFSSKNYSCAGMCTVFLLLLYARAGSAPSVCEVKHIISGSRNIFVMGEKKK